MTQNDRATRWRTGPSGRAHRFGRALTACLATAAVFTGLGAGSVGGGSAYAAPLARVGSAPRSPSGAGASEPAGGTERETRPSCCGPVNPAALEAYAT